MKTLCFDEIRPRGILSSRISRAREQNYSRSSILSNRSRHRISYQNVVHGAAQKRRKLSASIPMTVAIENRHLRIQTAIVDHDGKSIEASLLPQNFRSGLASLDKRNTGSIDGVNSLGYRNRKFSAGDIGYGNASRQNPMRDFLGKT
jgi:hypothetical protein